MTSRRRLFILIFIAALIVIGGAVFQFVQNARTTEIPSGTPSGDLAFISDRAGTWDLYLLQADGELRNLTENAQAEQPTDSDDYFASWDFKGERLNFISDRTGELSAAQIAPDGTGFRNLSIADAVTTLFFEGRLDWDPARSPSGERLLWASLRDLNLELYAANNDGSDEVRLTNNGGRDWFASWSPDGTQIAFTSDRDGNENIYVMSADGSNLRQITTDTEDDIHPAWSLDGASLLFVSERQNDMRAGVLDLFVVPANGDESDVRPLAADEVFESDPIYSLDGETLVYTSNQGGDWNLYQRNLSDNSVRRLTDSAGDDLFPVWRPSGDS